MKETDSMTTQEALKIRRAYENIRNNYVGWRDNVNFEVLEKALSALATVSSDAQPVAWANWKADALDWICDLEIGIAWNGFNVTLNKLDPESGKEVAFRASSNDGDNFAILLKALNKVIASESGKVIAALPAPDVRSDAQESVAAQPQTQCRYPLCQSEAEQDRVATEVHAALYSGEVQDKPQEAGQALPDEQIRFRFFKNLNESERLAVFKAFGVYPDNCNESLNHSIERRLLDAILKRRAAQAAPAVPDGCVAAQTAQPTAQATERDLERALKQRDSYHDIADKLAEAIAVFFSAEIGEHSSSNCPWHEALEVIANASLPEPVEQCAELKRLQAIESCPACGLDGVEQGCLSAHCGMKPSAAPSAPDVTFAENVRVLSLEIVRLVGVAMQVHGQSSASLEHIFETAEHMARKAAAIAAKSKEGGAA